MRARKAEVKAEVRVRKLQLIDQDEAVRSAGEGAKETHREQGEQEKLGLEEGERLGLGLGLGFGLCWVLEPHSQGRHPQEFDTVREEGSG